MTAETLVGQQADLLASIAELLNSHPAGRNLRLMVVADELSVGEDEVFVQVSVPGSRTIELHPRKLSDLTVDDVVHGTHVLNPLDEDFRGYAASPVAASCLKRYDLQGKPVHIYD